MDWAHKLWSNDMGGSDDGDSGQRHDELILNAPHRLNDNVR